MSRSNDRTDCRQVGESLELWLDGELERSAAEPIREHLQSCSICAAEAQLSKAVRDGLRALPEWDAPATTLASILEQTSRARAPRRRWSRLALGLPRPAWVAMATAATLALAFGLTVLRQPAPQPQTYDEAAIAQATAEARFALIKTGLLTAKAGRIVRDRALRDQILVPTRRSLEQSLGIPSLPAAPLPAGGVDSEGVNDA